MRRVDSRTRAVAVAASALLLAAIADAADLWVSDDGRRSAALQTSLKLTAVGEYAPDDPLLYPDRTTGSALLRLRNTLRLELGERTSAELAYEVSARQQIEGRDSAAWGGVSIGPGDTPYRAAQLDWSLASISDRLGVRQEIDRVFVVCRPEWGEIALGRQAVGIGRGVIYSALDLFAPFASAEPDREWRRGVDAVLLEVRHTELTSYGVIAVFGDHWEESAVLGRWRGYRGSLDAEFLFGKRREDAMVGVAASTTAGDAEAHMELAVFRTRDSRPDGGALGSRRLALKSVVGVSYTLDIGNGLTALGEYHYSGFGVRDVGELGDGDLEAFYDRVAHGDMQALGRHAIGLQLSYPVNDRCFVSALFLTNPHDGSGLFSPGIQWSIGSFGSLRVNAFAPWGSGPKDGELGSEYGAVPATLTAQLAVYF